MLAIGPDKMSAYGRFNWTPKNFILQKINYVIYYTGDPPRHPCYVNGQQEQTGGAPYDAPKWTQ